MDKIIEHNRKAHNKIVNKYRGRHKEIYNEIEQRRLCENLGTIIENKSSDYLALDYGSGEGNLTKQLLQFGITVVAADVSDKSLEMINAVYGVDTILLDGKSASNIEDNKYDFIGMYSVVHHIPDYLFIIGELLEKLKPNGILYIDHEAAPSYWEKDTQNKINQFKRDATGWKGKIRKYLRPRNYINKLITMLVDSHYSEEGDLHVFMDDHLEWTQIIDKVEENCEIMSFKEYLLYNGDYDKNKYFEAEAEGLSDTVCLVARKL